MISVIVTFEPESRETDREVDRSVVTFDDIWEAIERGDRKRLEAFASEVPGFPDGESDADGVRWILYAIDGGARASVEWMLERGVDVSFVDSEGLSPIHAAVWRREDDRYDILIALLDYRAPGLGRRGTLSDPDGTTPLHVAARENDVRACEILLSHGADPEARAIDEYGGDGETPWECAESSGQRSTAKFLLPLTESARYLPKHRYQQSKLKGRRR